MTRHFDLELKDLKSLLLKMGGYVEKSIEQASLLVIRREPWRFREVQASEIEINLLNKEVDHLCFCLLAKQAPVAKDLRFILAVVKINVDLERMGDQAVNIGYAGVDYVRRPMINITQEMSDMTERVRLMVRDSLDALVNRDVELSRLILERDEIVDQYKARLLDYLQDLMVHDRTLVESALDLIMIARNMERLADHATNIAEEVIFLATGEDVRHKGARLKEVNGG